MSNATLPSDAWGTGSGACVPLAVAILVPYLLLGNAQSAPKVATEDEVRPWWRAGGMHVTMVGSVATIIGPAAVFGSHVMELPSWVGKAWVTFGLALVALSLPSWDRNFYAGFILPLYVTTLPVLLVLPVSDAGVVATAAVAALLFLFKVGVGMSVCLHRYAAHAAFRCGPATRFALSWVACLANQGGPIWWASQHRCHHKHCDGPRDPHSAARVGLVKAFAFFDTHPDVEEEFAPRHLESLAIRLLDTFGCVPVMLEFYVAYCLGGAAGLWASYTSAWLCQTVTSWFNIVNHPPPPPETTAAPPKSVCLASDGSAPISAWKGDFALPSPLYRILHGIVVGTTPFIGEEAHEHHHAHGNRAHRPGADLPYHLFVNPLRMAGLVWNVQERA